MESRHPAYCNTSSSDTTMLKHALEYAKRGWPVFPLCPNSKRPLTNNGFKAGTTNKRTIINWWGDTPTANIGICTGPLSGLVVLDVDVKNDQRGDDSLINLVLSCGADIPHTLVSCTPSGGYHYYFHCQDTEIRCSASKVGKGLDVRATGGYIVAPPSSIDGKVYRWEKPYEAVAIIPNWFLKAVADAGKKPGIPPHRLYVGIGADSMVIREGQRNNYIFDMARRLRDEKMPYELAEQQIVNAAEACDPPLSCDEAVRTLQSAYSHDPYEGFDDVIREMNQKHAVVMVGGKCRVINRISDPSFGFPEFTFSTTNDFKAFYGNKTMQAGSTTVRVAEYWLKSPARQGYEGIVFQPGTDTPPSGYFNLWQGLAITPQIGDCSLFLQHVRDNIAAGDQEVYNYVIAWMADAVQNPANRPGTALVFRGKQGTGKGMVANHFGPIFGRHYVHLTSSNQLVGRFNGHLGEAILLFADEAFWGGDKSAEGTLKSLITEPTLLIERKNLDAIQVKNHIHLMVASNNDWVVPAGLEERRFLVMDVSDQHQQDHAYFAAIVKQMEDGGKEALLHHLLNYDLTTVNLRKLPKTKASHETKLLSMSPIQKYWYSLLQNGTLEERLPDWNDGLVLAENLRSSYLKYANDLGVRRKATAEELRRGIGALVPSMDRVRKSSTGERKYYYQFPSLDACRRYFDSRIGMESDWAAPELSDDGFW